MKDFDLTNEEKVIELAHFHQGTTTDSRYLQMLYALEEMAKWKDEQWELNLREILYRTFYVHPHDCDHICTDDFECKGDFDQFVDEFIERLKNPDEWE